MRKTIQRIIVCAILLIYLFAGCYAITSARTGHLFTSTFPLLFLVAAAIIIVTGCLISINLTRRLNWKPVGFVVLALLACVTYLVFVFRMLPPLDTRAYIYLFILYEFMQLVFGLIFSIMVARTPTR